MAYNYAKWSQVKSDLASRLGDPGKVFWTDAECALLLTEALRYLNVLTLAFRTVGTVTLTSEPFVDLAATFTDDGGTSFPLAYSVTDTDLVMEIQYHLVEQSPGVMATWSAPFTLSEVTSAMQRVRDQFIADTGCAVTRDTSISVTGGAGGSVNLPSATIAIRRAAWVSGSTGKVTPLGVSSAYAGAAYSTPGSLLSPAVPRAYSTSSEPQLTLQLIPPPSESGVLDLLLVEHGAALSPSTGVVLGIPDDLTPAIKWGTLADLLTKDGPGKAFQLGLYASRRYEEWVQLALQHTIILQANLNGVPMPLSRLQSLDSARPDWQNSTRGRASIASAGLNLLAVAPQSSGGMIGATVVRPALIPPTDDDYLQIGGEAFDVLMGYATHIANFKLGGSDFTVTEPLLTAIRDYALSVNERLMSSTRYLETVRGQSTSDTAAKPYRYHRERDRAVQQ